MATLMKDTSAVYEGTVCSICHDNFKTPRYLPCKHSFCQDCLYSYINSHFKTTESRLGFNCPLCRDYIPNTCSTDNAEEWVRSFPENRILEKYVSSSDQKCCEACLRDSEEEEATHFCIHCNEKLCAVCTKCHKKGLTTRKHEIVSLSETSRMDVLPFHSKEEVCTKHQERPIELFCQDHEEPCCTMCVSTTHRTCETVEPIEETTTKLKQYFEGKEFDLLLERVEILEDKLMRTKTEQEMCVRQMENTSDRISEETERSFKEVIHHLQSLKNQFLTNMSKGVKKSKESYEKNINSLLDGIHCARFIKNKLEKSTGSKSAVELAVVYYSGKKCFDRLKKYDFQQLQTMMEEKKPDILKDIMDLTGVTDVKFLDKTNSVNTDLKKLQLCLITELSMKQKFIWDGTILSSGEFILTTRGTNRYGKDADECFILNNCGKITKRIKSISKPFGITEIENDTIVVCSGSKCLHFFENKSLNLKKSVKLSNEPYCIAYLSPYMYLAYGDKISKMNKSGVFCRTINMIQPSVKHIISTSANIVYSSRRTNEVVAINALGTTVWKYSSPGLLSPCGLGVDGEDNIYVAGKESDNVHVLTKDGQCVHVFEDITRPDFMKVDKERKLCFVGCMRKYVRVYEML